MDSIFSEAMEETSFKSMVNSYSS